MPIAAIADLQVQAIDVDVKCVQIYFARFLRRLIPVQHMEKVTDFLTEGMVGIDWVRASNLTVNQVC